MCNYWEDGTDTGLCEPLWSIRLNCQLMTKFEMMHILLAQVYGCISAHTTLWHQETKQEAHGGRNIFQSGEAQMEIQKGIENFCGLNWQLWRHKHWNITSLTFVSMFQQFYAVFYKPSTTPKYRRVTRNFHRGKQQPGINI